MIKGIILGFELYNGETLPLKIGDLVQRLDEDLYSDNFYTIIKIDKSKAFPYYLVSKENGELMNFCREELTKCHCSFFDNEKYVNYGYKVLLGAINIEDINYIKSKKLVDLELGWSDLGNIKYEDLIGLEFDGYIQEKTLLHDSDPNLPMIDKLVYFRTYKY